MNKKLAGTGLAIGLVAGAGAGLILELSGNAGAASGVAVTAAVGDSTADTTATTDTSATAATTDTSGTDAADPVRPDPTTKLGEVLKPLVDDGTITQDQADKVIAAIVAARPVGGPDGHRGPGGPFGGRIFGAGLDVVATTLGITTDEVRTALESGQTIADLAVSKGKTAQDVIDAVVADATTKINAAVTAGNLTQAQADTLIANLTTIATDFVNNVEGPGHGFGFPGLGGPGFGGPGHRGNDNDADDSATTAPSDTTVTTVGS